MKTRLLALIVSCGLAAPLPATEANLLTPAEAAAGWQQLFDGNSLTGWQANEAPATFRVAAGAIVVHGSRSHLFYTGPVANHDFKNFELSVDVLTRPGANSGVYFHTVWQPEGWPAKGYEVQVNNTQKDIKRTAGLYGIKDNFAKVAEDDVWFTLLVRVAGRHITVSVEGKLISDFTEPADWIPPENFPGRRLAHGTFALQGHDPESEVHYRNIKVRLLP
ncbi:MAG: DUF1080 domain-containing protein [Lacunisphaera sp.]|jgi:hypothetical protein|nr:DUF1080 domain-containing protein [Lacunisphaera sp.]